jgi:hypothetical protein
MGGGGSSSKAVPFANSNSNHPIRTSHQNVRYEPYPSHSENSGGSSSYRVQAHGPHDHHRQVIQHAIGHPPARNVDYGAAMVPITGARIEPHDSSVTAFANHTGSSISTSLLGPRFPLPSIQSFRDYQKLVLEILDRSDVEFLGGKRIVKRSGWRKLALAFQVSFECRSEVIEKDESGNVSSARFCQVGLSFLEIQYTFLLRILPFFQRAIMPDGRFSDGWGGCDSREKR